MNYAASVSDFSKSPKWFMNMLLGGLCMLLPLLGPMVILGWLVTGFWGRSEEDSATFPPFEFSQFDKYLERGLWPFLVPFVAGIVMVPLIWMAMIPMVFIGALFSSGNPENASGCLPLLAMLCAMCAAALVILAMTMVLVPLKLRAAMMQDFGKAFDLRFVKSFLALTWKETALSMLFVMIIGSLFFALGALALCVGIYLASVLTSFTWMHLHKQLYALYLSRGGEPVPLSPKLSPALATKTLEPNRPV